MLSAITKARSYSLCLAMLGSPIAHAAFAQNLGAPATLTSETATMHQEELEARGKALRKAIDAKYQKIESPGGPFAVSPPGHKLETIQRVDVTDLVLQYLPIGMSLTDAEALLKAGGFKSRITGPQDPKNNLSPEWNAGLLGGLRVVDDTHWFTHFVVTAKSSSPNGKNIAIVEASFFKQAY